MNYSKMLFFAGFFMIVSQASAMESGEGFFSSITGSDLPTVSKEVSGFHIRGERTGANLVETKSALQPTKKTITILAKTKEETPKNPYPSQTRNTNNQTKNPDNQ